MLLSDFVPTTAIVFVSVLEAHTLEIKGLILKHERQKCAGMCLMNLYVLLSSSCTRISNMPVTEFGHLHSVLPNGP